MPTDDPTRASQGRPRVACVVTHAMTAEILMRGQLGFLRAAGLDIGVIASPGPGLTTVGEREGTWTEAVPMEREIQPLADLVSLLRLVAALRRLAPDIVNATTPKAGLLGMVAARLAGVPIRVYTLRGLRLETVSGFKRWVLTAAERLASRCAHRVVCVSESLRRRYLELDLAPADKTTVLADGSSNGVDTRRFRPAEENEPETLELRGKLGIPAGTPVIGFVGRLTRDKGVEDLARAYFGPVLEAHPGTRLLLLGGPEEGDPLPAATLARLEAHPGVVSPGFVPDTAPYYRLMDVLAFPSYREGFPNAPLEAAASAVPVAGYAATGTVDAVAAGETGVLVPPGEVAELGAALAGYLSDPPTARRHGLAGRRRAESRFGSERIWQAWLDEYRRLYTSS